MFPAERNEEYILCIGEFVLTPPAQARTYKSSCSQVKTYRNHCSRQPFETAKNEHQHGCFPRWAILRISTFELTSLLFLHFLSVNHWYSRWVCIHFFQSCLELWHYRNLDLPETKINQSSCGSFKNSKNNLKLIMGKYFKICIYNQLAEISQLP